MKLLIVDDDPEMLFMAGYLLGRDARFQVSQALGGVAGLAAARKERPDAVLSDFRMTDLDGLGLLRGVRAEKGLERTPFVFCTGKREEALRNAMGAEEVNGFIVKPFDPVTLADDVFGFLKGPAA